MTRAGAAWRLAGTALAFALFGLAALVLSLTLFPLLALTAPDADTGTRRVQRAIRLAYRAFTAVVSSLSLVGVEVQGAAGLDRRGVLVVANHPSLIDVILLAGLMPQADCIVKQDLLANPFLRHAVRWAGFISNASPDGLVEECAARLRAGRSLLIFPEGTRSAGGVTRRFRRGAARIALAAGCEIVPVLIRCEPPILGKGEPWHRVPPRRPHFTLDVGAPIAAVPRAGEPAALAARRLTRQLEQHLAAATTAPALEPGRSYQFT